MKRLTIVAVAIFSVLLLSSSIFGQIVIGGFNTSTQTGGTNNFGTSPLPPSTVATNAAVGGLTRGSGVSTTGTGAARAMGGVAFNTADAAASIAANKFFTFTVKANSGYTLSLSSINPFDYRRSTTGPPSGLVQYQINGGAFVDITTVSFTSTASTGGSIPSINLSGITALQNLPDTSTVTFRIVPYGASASTGTFYFFDVANSTADDLAVNGTLSAVVTTPNLSINDVSLAEGNNGTTTFTFTVSLSAAAPTGGVTFDIATADGTATIADNDFVQKSLTGQTIPAGSASYTFDVSVNGDTTVEPDETFFVNVTNVTGANVTDGQGQGTIQNDDAELPVVQFEFSSYFEDESQTLTVGVERTGDTSGTTTVDYSTQSIVNNLRGAAPANGGTSCTMGVDYITASGTFTFGPEQQYQTFDIQLCGDLLDESTEAFRVVLSNPTNAVLGKQSEAIVEINDTASQYSNGTFIGFASEAFPYPSPITVTGAPSAISGLRVTLYDFFDFNPDDIDVLLVGPQGQQILLMADAGGSGFSAGTLTFQDNAGQVLPNNSALFDGKFEPTSWESGQPSFPAPAPSAPYNEPGSTVGGEVTLRSVFGGTNPNGTWNLYVRIENRAALQTGIRGGIRGWGLQFIAPTAASVSVSGQLRSGKTPVPNTTVMISGGNLTEPLYTKSNSFGNYSFDGLTVGQTYVVTVVSNRYNFPQSSIVLNLVDNIAGADFEAEER